MAEWGPRLGPLDCKAVAKHVDSHPMEYQNVFLFAGLLLWIVLKTLATLFDAPSSGTIDLTSFHAKKSTIVHDMDHIRKASFNPSL